MDQHLFEKLVSFDSTSRTSNLPLADFVCDFLDGPGIRQSRVASADGSKVNLVFSAGPQRSDRSGLVLSGHLDVVPANEPDWRSDPFTLTEVDGSLVGRGSSDMKGFIALAMERLRDAAAQTLHAPLVLALTYDEELGSLGAQRLAQAWPADQPKPRSAVIGEPTSLRVVRMHKGHLSLRVTFHGAAAHSGSPQLGINAVEPAGRLIEALRALKDALAQRISETSTFFPAVPYPVLNVTRIQGGQAINVIPDRCDLDLSVRLLPGDDSATLVEEVRDIVAAIEFDGRSALDVGNENPPLLTDEEAPIHRTLAEMLQQPQSHGVSFASDAGVFQRDLGMDCVLFGPGSIESAHRANESVPIEELHRARDVLEQLIGRACMTESNGI